MLESHEILIDLEGDIPFEEIYELVASCYVSCLMDLRQGFFPPVSDVESYRVLIDRLRTTYPEEWRKRKEKIVLCHWFVCFLDMVDQVGLLPVGVGSPGECVEILDLLLGREYPRLFGAGVTVESQTFVSEDPG